VSRRCSEVVWGKAVAGKIVEIWELGGVVLNWE
jgi:hypothetical protein